MRGNEGGEGRAGKAHGDSTRAAGEPLAGLPPPRRRARPRTRRAPPPHHHCPIAAASRSGADGRPRPPVANSSPVVRAPGHASTPPATTPPRSLCIFPPPYPLPRPPRTPPQRQQAAASPPRLARRARSGSAGVAPTVRRARPTPTQPRPARTSMRRGAARAARAGQEPAAPPREPLLSRVSPARRPRTPLRPQRGHPLGRGRPRQRTHRARAQRCRGQRRRRLSPCRPHSAAGAPPKGMYSGTGGGGGGGGLTGKSGGRPAHPPRRASRQANSRWSRRRHPLSADPSRAYLVGGDWGHAGCSTAPMRAKARRWVASICPREPTYAGGLWVKGGGRSRGGLKRRGQRPRAHAIRGSEPRWPCFEPSAPITQRNNQRLATSKAEDKTGEGRRPRPRNWWTSPRGRTTTEPPLSRPTLRACGTRCHAASSGFVVARVEK